MPATRTITVSALDEQKARLDLYLASLPDMPTRSRIKNLINSGRIKLNDQPAKPSSTVKTGDRIQLDIPEPVEAKIIAQPIPLKILYEDTHIIVVDKPAGMVVHPTSNLRTGTLVNALLHHCRDLSGIGGELKPGIVHRLDKLTSGVMVAAKSDRAHLGLAEQFKEHSVNRRYSALVHGVMEENEGTYTSLIARHPTHRKKMSAKVTKGKHAVTHYTVQKRFNYFSIIQCRLETGRTHQIRVHLSEHGHPVVGDPTYGKSRTVPAGVTTAQRSAIRQLKRQALHAFILGFFHPVSGDYLEFSSPLPPDMQAVITTLEKNL